MFATGEKCQVSEWDADKQKFRRSMPGYQQANEHLQNLTDKLRTDYRDARNADRLITNELLRSAMSGNATKRPAALPMLFAEYLTARKSEVKPSTLKSMNNTLSRLRRFSVLVGGLHVENYTSEVHRSLVAKMLDPDLDPSSVGVVHKHLLTFFKYCRETAQHRTASETRRNRKGKQPHRTYISDRSRP